MAENLKTPDFSLLSEFLSGTAKRVAAEHVKKLRDILAVPERRRTSQDMDLPGIRLHALKGVLKGNYAVSVSGNWRVTLRFEDGHAVDVDYADYH